MEEISEEIAKLNLEIKKARAEARLEHARSRARLASGQASLSLAHAKQRRRKARFIQLRDKFRAKGLPLTQAVKRAKKEAGRF
jgi:hypothetical protein